MEFHGKSFNQETLKRKSDLIPKCQEKIKRLKTQGYIEKVNPDETPVSGHVWYLHHFSTQQAKFWVVYDGSAEFRGKSID